MRNGIEFLIARSGAPWRDLLERYGPWESVYSRFKKWMDDVSWITFPRIKPRSQIGRTWSSPCNARIK